MCTRAEHEGPWKAPQGGRHRKPLPMRPPGRARAALRSVSTGSVWHPRNPLLPRVWQGEGRSGQALQIKGDRCLSRASSVGAGIEVTPDFPSVCCLPFSELREPTLRGTRGSDCGGDSQGPSSPAAVEVLGEAHPGRGLGAGSGAGEGRSRSSGSRSEEEPSETRTVHEEGRARQ